MVPILAAILTACSDSPTRPNELVPDTAHGTGLLLPWSELEGRIVYATPQQIILVDAVRREVRVIRAVLADEIPRELDLSPTRNEVAIETLVDRGPARTSVTHLETGAITRVISNATCPRYLRDGRLSYMLGDSVLIEGTFVARVQPSASACLAWSADGSFFIIPTGSTVQRVTLQTRTSQSIMTGNGVWIDPDISPDGRKLAIGLAGSVVQPNLIAVSNVDGTELREIASGVGAFGFKWSPNALRMLAITTASAPAGMYLYRVSDGTSQRLTAGAVYAAAWR